MRTVTKRAARRARHRHWFGPSRQRPGLGADRGHGSRAIPNFARPLGFPIPRCA